MKASVSELGTVISDSCPRDARRLVVTFQGMNDLAMHPSTVAIHAGRGPRTLNAPLNEPVVLASNFHGGAYAREQGSAAWSPLEEAIGLLEGGTATAFSSGIAAATAIVETLPMGAKV